MSEVLKVNACVYSRKGYERECNRDDFYMNGKFLSEHHVDNMQASMENRGNEYFFSVADHMEYSDDEQRANFSILREIGKFHEKITVHEGDLDFKIKELTSRVLETGKYLNSFMDMNNISETDPDRQMGFSGLLLSEGKAVAATYGTGHIYYCRGSVFKHMTADHAKPYRLVELGIISDEEAEDIQEKYKAEEEEKTNPVTVSDPVEVLEGDKFLLISDGIYNTLGEEYLEDILSMRSDSTYIAYRIISEAMKRNCKDDMTAVVVRIERITSSTGVIKKTTERPKASALKSTPPQPTYRYNKKKKNYKKYENVIYYAAVVLTAVVLILIVVLVIKSMYNRLQEPDPNVTLPTVSDTVTPSPTPPVTTEEPPETTPEPTPTPVQTETIEHTVTRGDTLTSIARQYYGEDYSFVEKLARYNEIPAPYDTIVLGQVIKIPPKEVLTNME